MAPKKSITKKKIKAPLAATRLTLVQNPDPAKVLALELATKDGVRGDAAVTNARIYEGYLRETSADDA